MATIIWCQKCGAETEHECRCPPEELLEANAIRELNDAFRADLLGPLASIAGRKVVITRGVAERGLAFVTSALDIVRGFTDFTPDNDPHGEHDFAFFTLDGGKLFWKMDYYDPDLEVASPDPADPEETTRVLTIGFAEEY